MPSKDLPDPGMEPISLKSLHFWQVGSLPLSTTWEAPKWKSLTCVQLFVIPGTVAHQPPLSMEFTRQEYQSGLPCLVNLQLEKKTLF